MKKQPTKRQLQIVENFIKNETKRMMKEVNQLDHQDVKIALNLVNSLVQGTTSLEHQTNDPSLKSFSEHIRKIRIEIMNYVEDNSNFKFLGNGKGFKLIKK